MEDIKSNRNSLLNSCQVGLNGLKFQAQESNVINNQPIIYENSIGEGALNVNVSADNRDDDLINEKTNLIVNYLPADMVERELCDLFGKFGRFRNLKIIRDVQTGFSYCFGFVNFEQPRCAAIAQFFIDGREVRGKRLKVSFAHPKTHFGKNANLYVSRLPPTMNENKLLHLFGIYGNVVDVNILRNKFTGRPRGVAFVRFDHHISAEMAQEALDQYLPPGSQRRIDVRFVIPKIKPPLGLYNGDKWMSSPLQQQQQQQQPHLPFPKGHNRKENHRQYLGLQNGKMIYEYQPKCSTNGLNNSGSVPMEPPQKVFPDPIPRHNNVAFYNRGLNNPGFNNPGFNNHVNNNPGFSNHGFNYHGYNNPGLNNPGFYNPTYGNSGLIW